MYDIEINVLNDDLVEIKKAENLENQGFQRYLWRPRQESNLRRFA